MQPIIGITAGEIHDADHKWSPVIYGQSYTYVEAVSRSGGVPVIVPLLKDLDELRQLYNRLDGILFAGGNDVSPHLYGQEPYPTTKHVSDFRDQTELQLMKWALEDGKPMLCICRGMELLNIVQGGTLWQDVHKDIPGTLDHNHSTKLQTLIDTSHALRLKPDSQLADILGTETIGTNAHHHQAIKDLGKDIVPVAWTSDDIIEAIELDQKHNTYAIGVQSHPESLAPQAEPRWRALFDSFVLACFGAS
jgi:putative glutamine amidotransferase